MDMLRGATLLEVKLSARNFDYGEYPAWLADGYFHALIALKQAHRTAQRFIQNVS
jgi:hypothetical protein